MKIFPIPTTAIGIRTVTLNAPTELTIVDIVDNGDGTSTVTFSWNDTNSGTLQDNTGLFLMNGDLLETVPGEDVVTGQRTFDNGRTYDCTVQAISETLQISSEPSNTVRLVLVNAPGNVEVSTITDNGDGTSTVFIEWNDTNVFEEETFIIEADVNGEYQEVDVASGEGYGITLENGALYHVRIRLRVTVDGVYYYSPFSNVVEVDLT